MTGDASTQYVENSLYSIKCTVHESLVPSSEVWVREAIIAGYDPVAEDTTHFAAMHTEINFKPTRKHSPCPLSFVVAGTFHAGP